MALHWTQRPENRAKVARVVAAAAAAHARKRKGTKHTAATRAKIGASIRAAAERRLAYAERRREPPAASNGHGPDPGASVTMIRQLARVGARVRLAELDRERAELLVFLDEAGE